MSNSTFVWTPEETVIGFAQFSKGMELAREGQRSPESVSRALQAVIMGDDIIVVPKVTQTPTGRIFHVTSDVKIRTAADAIAATNCPLKWGLAETPKKIPMIIQPVDCKVRAIPLGQIRTTEEVYSLYPKIVTPAEFFAFGAKFPEEQTQAPHFTVWLDATGQFWYAILYVIGDKRDVVVIDFNPGGRFRGHYRALVRE